MKKVKVVLLEMNNFYDVQKSQEDNKVFIVITFLKDYVFEWWISKKLQEPKVVASLIWIGFV